MQIYQLKIMQNTIRAKMIYVTAIQANYILTIIL